MDKTSPSSALFRDLRREPQALGMSFDEDSFCKLHPPMVNMDWHSQSMDEAGISTAYCWYSHINTIERTIKVNKYLVFIMLMNDFCDNN